MTTPIKNILDHLLENQNNWQLQLLANWDKTMGHLQTKVQLVKILDDTLLLGVTDPCWMQELFLLSSLLIKTINQSLDQPRIKYLRFKTIGVKKQKSKQRSFTRTESPKELLLSSKEERALKQIDDPALETALKNYLQRCHQEK
jgi:flagellar biogenesis protein FliO